MVLDTEKGIPREDDPSSVVGTEMLLKLLELFWFISSCLHYESS